MSRSAVIRDFAAALISGAFVRQSAPFLGLICRPARRHALAQITFGGLRSVTGLEWFASLSCQSRLSRSAA